MKRLFEILKKFVKWYSKAVVNSGVMCPSCMIPIEAYEYMLKTSKK